MSSPRTSVARLPSFPLLVLVLALGSAACEEGPPSPPPAEPRGAPPAPTPTSGGATTGGPVAPTPAPSAAPSSASHADTWLRISKGGYDLGVVEVLRGKPWRVVLHSSRPDARALEERVNDRGGEPIGLDMHLPSEGSNERGAYGTALVPPGDKLYPFAVEEHLKQAGFDVSRNLPHFADENPPKSVSKLEFSRDGEKVGTLDLTVTPPRLDLANREGNAIFLETFWQGLEAEDPLIVSYLVKEDQRDVLTTVSAKKGTPAYPNLVRVAFAVRYPNFTMVVVP